jgi:hypothetical protein
MPKAKKLAAIVLLVLTALFGATHLAMRSISHTLPDGRVAGPEADALARALEASVDGPAWARTGAVRWLARTGARHLWDRRRGFARVTHGDTTVWLDTATRAGVGERGGQPLEGDALRSALETAYALWINDSFWLNPLVKLFDDGVVRERAYVEYEGRSRTALLASYTKGGLTPGDRYLWIVGDDGRPLAFRIWVSVLPVPGLEITWGGWTQLPTGAWISTEHRLPFGVHASLAEVAGAATLDALEPGPDPFARLASVRS